MIYCPGSLAERMLSQGSKIEERTLRGNGGHIDHGRDYAKKFVGRFLLEFFFPNYLVFWPINVLSSSTLKSKNLSQSILCRLPDASNSVLS